MRKYLFILPILLTGGIFQVSYSQSIPENVSIGIYYDTPPFSYLVPKNDPNISLDDLDQYFTFREYKDQVLRGLDISVAKLIIKKLLDQGINVTVAKREGATERMDKLLDGSDDMSIAIFSITDKRLDSLDFSTPYYHTDKAWAILGKGDLSEVNFDEPSSLGNRTIRSVPKSTAYEYLNSKNVLAEYSDNNIQLFRQLFKKGSRDLIINDFAVLDAYHQVGHDDINIKRIQKSDSFGIAFRKNQNALVEFVNRTLLENDAFLKELNLSYQNDFNKLVGSNSYTLILPKSINDLNELSQLDLQFSNDLDVSLADFLKNQNDNGYTKNNPINLNFSQKFDSSIDLLNSYLSTSSETEALIIKRDLVDDNNLTIPKSLKSFDFTALPILDLKTQFSSHFTESSLFEYITRNLSINDPYLLLLILLLIFGIIILVSKRRNNHKSNYKTEPQVDLYRPDYDPFYTNKPSISLSGLCGDNYKIRSVKIDNNKARIKKVKHGHTLSTRNNYHFEYSLPLNLEENEKKDVVISVENHNRICTKHSFTVIKKPYSLKYLGKTYLWIIANSNYAHFPNLGSSIDKDANLLSKVLVKNYRVDKVHISKDLEEKELKKCFNELRNQPDDPSTRRLFSDSLTEEDNLIIYYSGHGYFNGNTGYWIPVDGKDEEDFIRDMEIIDSIDSIKMKHKLLISDSCFSGSLVGIDSNSPDYIPRNDKEQLKSIQRELASKSSTVLTSGSEETVPSKSEFFKHLIEILETNEAEFLDIELLSRKLFHRMKKSKPKYGPMKKRKNEKIALDNVSFNKFYLLTK